MGLKFDIWQFAARPALCGASIIIAIWHRNPEIALARNPSRPFACSSFTIARPIAIISATAASDLLIRPALRRILPRRSAFPTTLLMHHVHGDVHQPASLRRAREVRLPRCDKSARHRSRFRPAAATTRATPKKPSHPIYGRSGLTALRVCTSRQPT